LDHTRVLGVRVDCVDMPAALSRIEAMVVEGGHHLVATINPEFVMLARRDPEFARTLESASLSLPDGSGVVWAARRQGCALPGTVTGTDLVEPIAELCARRGWRLFLLGAGPGVAAELAKRLEERHAGLSVGHHTGHADAWADDDAIRVIREHQPDILLVAFGAPKQEMWIERAGRRIDTPVAIGVGGAFDYLTGRVPRAPEWMRRAGMEWTYRLARQPWRARRMAVLPGFAFRVLRGR
jgi:N-acetylglucosaminyldiphosphoundecaprenol N-acetyl-beta-D-mannosaminyltransferase